MGFSSGTRYSSYGRLPREQPGKKFWDPVTTLGMINPDRDCLTCVGYAPSRGRRCRNPINMGNLSSASQLLEDLSYINVSTTNIDAKLRQLAGLTLCLRYHQSQGDEMVKKWNRKIESLQSTARARTESDIIWERLQKEYGRLKTENGTVKNENESTDELLARLLDRVRRWEESERREEEARKSREQEQQRQRQEREKKERRKKEREEQARRKREEEEERKKREEEEERKKREEEEERKKREEEEERKKHEEEEEEERKKLEEEQERQQREEAKRRKEAEEAKAREAREREERNERVRQRAEQMRKERERKAKEQAAKAREEWDKVWLDYVMRWDDLKKNDSKGSSEELRETIPWPVKSGCWKDVSGPAVEEFFRKAPPEDSGAQKMAQFMKMECLKWHADRIPRMFGEIHDEGLAGLFHTVAQVAVKMRAETASKREQ